MAFFFAIGILALRKNLSGSVATEGRPKCDSIYQHDDATGHAQQCGRVTICN